MTYLVELASIEPDDARQLEHANIATAEELTWCIQKRGLSWLAIRAGVTVDALRQLAEQAGVLLPDIRDRAGRRLALMTYPTLDALWEAVGEDKGIGRLSRATGDTPTALRAAYKDWDDRRAAAEVAEVTHTLAAVAAANPTTEPALTLVVSALAPIGVTNVAGLRAQIRDLGIRALASQPALALMPGVRIKEIVNDEVVRYALRPIEELTDAALAARLGRVGVHSIGEFRQQTVETGRQRVARSMALHRTALRDLLVAQGIHEVKRKHDAWRRRNWLVLMAGLLVLGAWLSIRAGLGAFAPSQLLSVQHGAIAVHDLRAGDVLAAEDVKLGPISAENDSATTPGVLIGARIEEDVAQGRPILQRQVRREQVLATRNIAAGEVLPRDAVRLDWSELDPEAAVRAYQVVGWRAARPIAKDQVVETTALELSAPDPTLVSQVIVRRPDGLQPFQPIRQEDIALRDAVGEPGVLTSVDQAIDRYAFQSLPVGAPIRSDQLGPRSLPGSDPTRRVVTVMVTGGVTDRVQPGARLILHVVPHGNGTPVLVPDAIVLGLYRTGAQLTLVVWALERDVAAALPLLGQSDIYVAGP
ncbi:MAG: hypothetical protein IT305_19450 [Chloroflexi bacterium]|nr:hypothetical protein [Chloroflexota bacterium]